MWNGRIMVPATWLACSRHGHQSVCLVAIIQIRRNLRLRRRRCWPTRHDGGTEKRCRSRLVTERTDAIQGNGRISRDSWVGICEQFGHQVGSGRCFESAQREDGVAARAGLAFAIGGDRHQRRDGGGIADSSQEQGDPTGDFGRWVIQQSDQFMRSLAEFQEAECHDAGDTLLGIVGTQAVQERLDEGVIIRDLVQGLDAGVGKSLGVGLRRRLEIAQDGCNTGRNVGNPAGQFRQRKCRLPAARPGALDAPDLERGWLVRGGQLGQDTKAVLGTLLPEACRCAAANHSVRVRSGRADQKCLQFGSGNLRRDR